MCHLNKPCTTISLLKIALCLIKDKGTQFNLKGYIEGLSNLAYISEEQKLIHE